MNDNIRGSFNTSDCTYLNELNDHLFSYNGKRVKAADYLEAEFTGVYHYTPGRPFTLDADDAYPDETTDERQLTKVTLYCTDDTIIEITDDGELEELQEILDDLLYAAEITPLGRTDDRWEEY
jgi:hypothetical protein